MPVLLFVTYFFIFCCFLFCNFLLRTFFKFFIANTTSCSYKPNTSTSSWTKLVYETYPWNANGWNFAIRMHFYSAFLYSQQYLVGDKFLNKIFSQFSFNLWLTFYWFQGSPDLLYVWFLVHRISYINYHL